MKVAHIVPPAWISSFKKFRDGYGMALAHWAIASEEYGKALRIRHPDDYLILDNGAFEGQQVDMIGLKYALHLTGADEVVLPDVPGDGKATLELAWDSYQQLKGKRVMFVPQGTTAAEWKRCLDAWMKQWPGEDFLSIGIPSLARAEGGRQHGSKSDLLIHANQFNLPIHLLGMTTPGYFFTDLLPLALKANVRGVDTSTAFALGAKNILLDLGSPKIRLGSPGQYVGLSSTSKRLIDLNQAYLSYLARRGFLGRGVPEDLLRRTASQWVRYWARGFASLESVLHAVGAPSGRYALVEGRVIPLGEEEKVATGTEVLEIW